MNCLRKLLAWMWTGIHFILPPFLLHSILYTILNDEFLSGHISLAVLACVCFLTISYLLILASACKLRPRSSADRILSALRDTDFIFDHDIEISSLRLDKISQFFKKSFEFCKFRPVYGLIFAAGAGLFAIYLLIRITIDKNSQMDLFIASRTLIVPVIILICMVLSLANSGIYIRDLAGKHYAHSYQPFQEMIEIPMQIIAGKTLSAFINDGWMNFVPTLLLIAYTSISVYSLDYVCNFMPDTAFERLQMRSHVVNIRTFLALMLGLFTVAGVIHLTQMILISPFVKAKRCLLGIMEKNWRRNIPAIESLLPDVEVESLEELQAALNSIRTQRLTEAEKRALNYVDLPLWQTKLPFVDHRHQVNLSVPVKKVEEDDQKEKSDQEFAEQALTKSQRSESIDRSTSAESLEQPNGMAEKNESSEESSTSGMAKDVSLEERRASEMTSKYESREKLSTSRVNESSESSEESDACETTESGESLETDTSGIAERNELLEELSTSGMAEKNESLEGPRVSGMAEKNESPEKLSTSGSTESCQSSEESDAFGATESRSEEAGTSGIADRSESLEELSTSGMSGQELYLKIDTNGQSGSDDNHKQSPKINKFSDTKQQASKSMKPLAIQDRPERSGESSRQQEDTVKAVKMFSSSSEGRENEEAAEVIGRQRSVPSKTVEGSSRIARKDSKPYPTRVPRSESESAEVEATTEITRQQSVPSKANEGAVGGIGRRQSAPSKIVKESARVSRKDSKPYPMRAPRSSSESPEVEATTEITREQSVTSKANEGAAEGIGRRQSAPSKIVKESARVSRKDSKPYPTRAPRSRSVSPEVEATTEITRQQSVPSRANEGDAEGIGLRQSAPSKIVKESARASRKDSKPYPTRAPRSRSVSPEVEATTEITRQQSVPSRAKEGAAEGIGRRQSAPSKIVKESSRISRKDSKPYPTRAPRSRSVSPEVEATTEITRQQSVPSGAKERVAEGIGRQQSAPSKIVKESARVSRKDSKPYPTRAPRSGSESPEVEATTEITRQQSVPSITNEGAAGGIVRWRPIPSKSIEESARVTRKDSKPYPSRGT